MPQLTAANIAIALECLIGTASVCFAGVIYSDAATSLLNVFG